MIIKKVENLDTDLENMIGTEFSRLAAQNQLNVDYSPYTFVAEENEEVIGLITGHACYNEVYISDLILLEKSRRKGSGSKLLRKVEDYFRGKGYEIITLTTYEFQARDFYLKNGYEIEYIRENKATPPLTKYYFEKKY